MFEDVVSLPFKIDDMRYNFVIIMLVSIAVSCKERKQGEDPILREALTIQDEGIHLGIDIDSMLSARMTEGALAQDIPRLQMLKKQIEDLKHNMVIIPGIEHDHDHSGHDHAGHDHSGHDHSHDHSKDDVASSLSPADQLKVQTEWKAAILAIRDSLK